jgi:hypothetical protein
MLLLLLAMLRLRALELARRQRTPRHHGLELEQHGTPRAVLRKHIAAAVARRAHAGEASGDWQLKLRSMRWRALATYRIRGGGVAIAVDEHAAAPDTLPTDAYSWHLQPRPLRW